MDEHKNEVKTNENKSTIKVEKCYTRTPGNRSKTMKSDGEKAALMLLCSK